MEMHQVRYFLAVAQELNFSRAAEKCNVTQPSLSRAIQQLEGELGGPLFHRERHLTHLTDLGQMVRPHLETVYNAAVKAKSLSQDLSQLKRVPLKLGIMSTISPDEIVDLIAALKTRYDGLELRLCDANAKDLRERLLAGDHHLLAKQRHHVGALVGFFARQRIDDDLESASQKARAQIFCIRIAKPQLYVGMAGPNIGDKINDLVGRDCAHDAELERHLLREVLRQVLDQHRVMINRLKMRPDHLAELREVCWFAVAVKKRSAELLLEKLDCARQGRLRHIALFASAREIQFLCHRKEITNLMHFHDDLAELRSKTSGHKGKIIASISPLVPRPRGGELG